jgi:GMP synthase-like glutamine amidotransferase
MLSLFRSFGKVPASRIGRRGPYDRRFRKRTVGGAADGRRPRRVRVHRLRETAGEHTGPCRQRQFVDHLTAAAGDDRRTDQPPAAGVTEQATWSSDQQRPDLPPTARDQPGAVQVPAAHAGSQAGRGLSRTARPGVGRERAHPPDRGNSPPLLRVGDGVILSPGPGRPERAGCMVELLHALPLTTPVLGVCLGHQAIACAAGAAVDQAPAPVHGKASTVRHTGRAMFAGVPQSFTAGRYHSLVVRREGLPVALRTHRGDRGWARDGSGAPSPAVVRRAVPSRVAPHAARLPNRGNLPRAHCPHRSLAPARAVTASPPRGRRHSCRSLVHQSGPSPPAAGRTAAAADPPQPPRTRERAR